MNGFMQFLHEVRVEFGRIEWPSVAEWLEATRVVLVVVALFTVFFAVVDQGLSFAVKQVLTYGLW